MHALYLIDVCLTFAQYLLDACLMFAWSCKRGISANGYKTYGQDNTVYQKTK